MAEAAPSTDTWMCRLCYEDNAASTDECTACKAPKVICWWKDRQRLYDSTGDYESLDGIEEADHDKVTKIIQKIKAIREECSQNGTLYTDKTFRGDSAIRSPTVKDTVQLRTSVDKWLRPTELCSILQAGDDPWTLFNGPKPSDPIQRELGDCWFVSAMQIVALRPNLLKCNFITKRYNKEGIYGVRLFKNGQWVNTIIDDKFPCTDEGAPLFSWCRRKQLWVGLLEKAAAKLLHSYLDLEAGWGNTAFRLLTGYGSVKMPVNHELAEKIVNFIVQTREKGIIHTAEIMGELPDDEYRIVGLKPHHSYGVIEVKTFQDGRRILLIRDAGCTIEYKGDWGSGSKLWQTVSAGETPVMGRLGTKGLFWMSVDDFGKYFETMTALYIRPTWPCTRSVVSIPAGAEEVLYEGLEIEVEETLSIDIFSAQLYPLDHVAGDHPGILVIVEDDGNILNCTDADVVNNLFISVMLRPGKYRVYFWTFTAWLNNAAEHVSLITYSSKLLSVRVCKEPKNHFVKQVLTYIVAKGKVEDHVDRDCQLKIHTVGQPDWMGVMVAAVNLHPVNTCELSLYFSNRGAFTTPRIRFNTTDAIPPKHGQILNILSLKLDRNVDEMERLVQETRFGQAAANLPQTHNPHFTPETEALFGPVPYEDTSIQ